MVHRRIRITHDILGCHMILGRTQDTDAGRAIYFLAVEIERQSKLSLDPLRNAGDLLGVISSFDQDHEFVPAEPGNDVGRPHTLPKPVGNADQELVTDEVSETVVYKLESIQVDKKN